MEKSNKYLTDVLVVGSGIAGLMAALSAAKEQVKVTLLTSTKLFTGSSFYPGTWGMGSVGPLNQDDIPNFIATIIEVGCHIPDPKLVEILVKQANLRFKELEDLGFNFKRKTENDPEFIPCFDYKQRSWRGIVGEELKRVFSKLIKDYNITVIEEAEALELLTVNNQVSGLLVAHNQELKIINTKSMVLASGGYGGLFYTRLNTNDITGSGLGMALRAGAVATNLEFNQFMPGFLKPGYRTVFNEKIFRYSRFLNYKKEDLLAKNLGEVKTKEVLALRSEHGPFSTRNDSKLFDINVYQHNLINKGGVIIKYDQDILEKAGGFSKIYFDWLEEHRNVKITDEVTLGLFFQAANGGLKINQEAATSILGLYAAGEVSGGMHGADRIGGLSSVNGLVFGKIAGINAANFVKKTSLLENSHISKPVIKDANKLIERLQHLSDQYLGIVKSRKGLTAYLNEVEAIEKSVDILTHSSIKETVDSYRLTNLLVLAKVVAEVMIIRQESRGSFYREDYPNQDHSFQFPFLAKYVNNQVEIKK
jgi:aspartate oxidase